MSRERSFRRTNQRALDGSIHAAMYLADGHPGVRLVYERLLCHLQSRTDLLRPRRRCGDRAGNSRCAINAALFALALHHEDWLRPVESWVPPSRSAWPQFAALAQHLFALYPVPAFMTTAWFETPQWQKLPHHEWYKHLGRGQSIRRTQVPIRCSKAIAHWFNHAPDHYPVSAALRWAQVRGLGGKETLARAVIATRLGRSFGHEDFWLTVLHFFVTNPKLDVAQVGPIVDFLQYQRFGSDEGVLVRRQPPQPEYSMKGRTVASLLRQVDEWHKQLGRDGAAAGLQWCRSPIGEFEQVEGSEELENLRRWTITQLLSSRELRAEGLAMRHCVAIYAGACARKQTSIWSLRVETAQGQRRLLTIEVDLARRTICQARRSCNALPKEKEMNLLQEWARRERLRIAPQL